MPVVSVREVETFREAAAGQEIWKSPSILSMARLTRRELAQKNAMIPIEILGVLWKAAANRCEIPFALSVAEAHTDTTKVYGPWGEMMDCAPNVEERLLNGFALMGAHADDPKWALKVSDDRFWLVRRWHYPNTTPRAEAFAAISELREWLIVMQRSVREPLQPLGLSLNSTLYDSVGEDERNHLAGFFGGPIFRGDETSLVFPRAALHLASTSHDPEKFSKLLSSLTGGPKIYLKNLPKEEQRMLSAPPLQPPLKTEYEPHLAELDSRHRAALHHAALDAADYFAFLGKEGGRLIGVDIGGGNLEVTALLLYYLKVKTKLGIELTVVDPELQNVSVKTRQRMEKVQRELGINIRLAGVPWKEFEKNLPQGSRFDFAFTCQVFSLLTPAEILDTYSSIHRRLAAGGKLFAAFEPYDQATLPQYRHLLFHHKPVEWYREQAREAGFYPDLSRLYPAHASDSTQAFVCLRFQRVG